MKVVPIYSVQSLSDVEQLIHIKTQGSNTSREPCIKNEIPVQGKPAWHGFLMSSMQYHQTLLKGTEENEPHVSLSSHLTAAKEAVPSDGGQASDRLRGPSSNRREFVGGLEALTYTV